MIKNVTLTAAAAFALSLFASDKGFAVPPATCIGHHCAVVGGGAPALAVPPVLVATGLGLPAPGVFHPAVGIYCVVPPAKPLKPYVPLVSVDVDLTIPLAAGLSPGASLAHVNFAGAGCVKPGAPFALEVDTFQLVPGAGPPIAIPSNNVGFSIQF